MQKEENKIISMVALLPRSKRLLVGVLTLVAILCLGFILQSFYHDSALKSAQRRNAQLKNELKSTKVSNNSYEDDTDKYNSLKNYLRRDIQKFMRQKDSQPIIQSISVLSAENNLTVTTVDPEQEKIENQFVYIPIEVTLQGHYHDIAKFISGLAQLRQVVSVEELSMNRVSGDLIDTTMLLRAYQPILAPIKKGDRQ